MNFKLSLSIFTIVFFCALIVKAQRKTPSAEIQIEIGGTLANFFDSRGISFNEGIKLSYRNFSDFINSNFYSNFYYGLKVNLRDKHCLSVHYQSFQTTPYSPPLKTQNVELLLRNVKSFGLGYNYILPFQKFQTMIGIGVNYRYSGGEQVIFAYWLNPPPGWNEPISAYVEYNSLGLSPGIEVNWFWSSHFGIGVRSFYQYFPFESNKLSGNGIEMSDPDLVSNYKPGKQMFTLDFKLAYRFSPLKLLKNNKQK